MKSLINLLNKELKWALMVTMILIFQCINAQEVDEIDYYFDFTTTKLVDNSRALDVSFYGRMDREKIPVVGATIQYHLSDNGDLIELGQSVTDREGKGRLVLEKSGWPADEEGYITFIASFEGSEGIDAFEEELSIIDVQLELMLEESDDEKLVNISAMAVMQNGSLEPIEEGDIYFFIQGMLTKLPIEEGWIDMGEYSFQFPNDIPGDKDGNVIIYAVIEDSYEYGNVIQSAPANWGIGAMSQAMNPRSLWSSIAPRWMMVVLAVLFILVWANILHAVFALFQIKRLGKV